jgi:hypothetical protein
MKRKEFSREEVDSIIRMYNDDYKGTPTISKEFNCSKAIINRVLRENGIELGPSGRKWTGGKKVSAKKYHSKPEVKDRKSKTSKEWFQQNKEHRKEYHKEWREKNKIYYQKYRRDYEKTKKDSDPSYRLACYTRTAIYTCLKERDVTKYKSTFDLLPYSLEELILHLESQFKEGMTWDNYGEWHVDHIKPMTSFNIQSPEDKPFQECWSLGNLQPLWGNENLSKGSRYLLV